MSNLFPIILSCTVFSVILGMYLGFLLAIYMYTNYVYPKRNEAVLRLRNIHEVAQGLHTRAYGELGGIGEENALLFILCESDLNIRKADLNTECYERMVEKMDSMDGALIDSQRLTESEVVNELLERWKGYENLKRVKAFVALDGEREYQEKFNSDVLSVGEELCLIQCYVNKAMIEYANTRKAPSEPATMDVIRKIGAMCLRSMENHEIVERQDTDEKES